MAHASFIIDTQGEVIGTNHPADGRPSYQFDILVMTDMATRVNNNNNDT